MRLSQDQMRRIAQYVRDYLMKTSQRHGHTHAKFRAENRWRHTLNVQKNIRTLANMEGITADEQQICDVAALFHDIDHYTIELAYHGIRGAETAEKFLLSEGYPASFVKEVSDAVRHHHFVLDDDLPIREQMQQHIEGTSRVAQLLMDAETLDKIGASNILQSVLTMGRNDWQLGRAARELLSGFPLERARLWYQTLVTEAGRKVGVQRVSFYEQMLAQIESEIVIDEPYPAPVEHPV
ncbi:MAG: hypothetical protein OHK0023_28780 [Anaerolineae bacterium]